MKLQGIFPAVATPFNHEGDIWKAKVEHNISKWNAMNLAGYVITGSTGESVLLSAAERVQLWEWAAQYAAPEKILIAGTASESARETVQLANQAASLGYKAALVLTPHYYKASFNNAAAQRLFYGAVADQSKIPILLYNLPQCTGLDLAADAVAELSYHPNIAGIKDSSGDIGKMVRMVREVKPGFAVLTGNSATLAPALAVGATGAILAIANAVPYACISIWEAHRTREPEAALDWQGRIEKPSRIAGGKYGIPGIKHAMDLMGYYGGPPRLPFIPPSPQAKKEIEEAFTDLRG
ncbi:MAG TPA: dihydrodipicolinate synthase family protein [Bryobacteraceae bacterium]|jgi:4-hydroxy-2-oxoglutarate aldolase|nr:dihydrodipicolinate synthase family protein [Bryobacteraceae bacterium]